MGTRAELALCLARQMSNFMFDRSVTRAKVGLKVQKDESAVGKLVWIFA